MSDITLRKLVYNVRALIKDIHADDIKFTDRNIAFWVGYLRAKLIKQESDKSRKISLNVVQDLTLKVNFNDKGNRFNDTTGYVEAVSEKIPKLVNSNKGNLLLSIYSTDDFIINIQNKSKAIRNLDSKYGSKFPVAYIEHDYLYFKSCSLIPELINVEGVFQDPLEVMRINNPGLTEDELWDLEYPIDSNLIDMLNSLIKSNELNLYFQLNEDKVNNAQNNSI